MAQVRRTFRWSEGQSHHSYGITILLLEVQIEDFSQGFTLLQVNKWKILAKGSDCSRETIIKVEIGITK